MTAILIFVILGLGGLLASAQSYSIPSSKIASGGGKSTGTGPAGQFAVTGAIGQPDAHTASTGGTYRLSGGFFSQFMALQTHGGPRLVVRRNGLNVEVAWPASVPGWVLQVNTADLNNAAWSDVAGAPTVSGPDQFHSFPMGSGRVFFRLRFK